ncbi:carboxypeptidase-like regulatory domain-containing protein [uncultured Polaribacter sp.]|uniref:carboxypeptidase-like regulatory domain-containing protein n=1 Tax=uncultured Polaribacter sp. TaxID=174711 RepID=UPI00263831B6|nr:carboxypeptidase-like regulatory domain-containing protein [uncultured Polaribacter sp.]
MKYLLFFLLISTQLFSQKVNITGKLVDKETNEPVVYANISFLNSKKGISSNEDGTFSINLDKKYLENQVHISCLNFKDTVVYAKNLQNNILKLEPKAFTLDEITLTKRIEQSVVLGEVKNKVEGVHTSGMRMLAKYFPNDKRVKCCNFLEAIEIHFSKRNVHQKKSKFRIRIFSKDDKTGLPKEDILNVNLPVEIEDGQEKVTIDISNFNIEMPENGIFIAFEKLLIPFNAYGKKEIDTENEFFYSPIIGYTKYNKKDRNSNMYMFVKGKWQLSPLSKVKIMRKYAPAIALKLTN